VAKTFSTRAPALADLAEPAMHDSFITRSVRFTLILLISVIAFGCLVLSYLALFELIGGAVGDALEKFAWGAALAIAALLLIHFRGDLVDDEV
jgi:hypothetical protein